MKEVVVIEAQRTAYGLDGVYRTTTVKELISFLSDWDENSPVYLSFDNGYTYGGITCSGIVVGEISEDGEFEEY